MNKILTLIEREWADIFRNRMVAMTVILLPVLMIVIPTIVLLIMTNEAIPMLASDIEELPPAVLEQLPFDTSDPRAVMVAYMGQQFNLLFLIVPLAIPMTIASYSIVGEKREGSLEPLLATPISTAQLLAAKSIAAALPGLVETWLGYAIYVGGMFVIVNNPLVRDVLLAPQWVLSVLLLAPLLTLLATTVGLTISSRVNDPRMAEQLGMIVIVPIMGLFIAQLAGLIFIGVTTILVLAILLAAVDYGLLLLAVRLFRRETILTRWK